VSDKFSTRSVKEFGLALPRSAAKSQVQSTIASSTILRHIFFHRLVASWFRLRCGRLTSKLLAFKKVRRTNPNWLGSSFFAKAQEDLLAPIFMLRVSCSFNENHARSASSIDPKPMIQPTKHPDEPGEGDVVHDGEAITAVLKDSLREKRHWFEKKCYN